MSRRPTKRVRAQRCPCGSARLYARCCGALHEGQPALSPDQLMRSRYSAYAGGLVDYIVETTDPDGPHWREDTDGWRTELIEWCETTEFLGLRVLGSDSDSTGHWVEFEARLSASGRSHSLVERSLFVKREGRWLYREALAR